MVSRALVAPSPGHASLALALTSYEITGRVDRAHHITATLLAARAGRNVVVAVLALFALESDDMRQTVALSVSLTTLQSGVVIRRSLGSCNCQIDYYFFFFFQQRNLVSRYTWCKASALLAVSLRLDECVAPVAWLAFLAVESNRIVDTLLALAGDFVAVADRVRIGVARALTFLEKRDDFLKGQVSCKITLQASPSFGFPK